MTSNHTNDSQSVKSPSADETMCPSTDDIRHYMESCKISKKHIRGSVMRDEHSNVFGSELPRGNVYWTIDLTDGGIAQYQNLPAHNSTGENDLQRLAHDLSTGLAYSLGILARGTVDGSSGSSAGNARSDHQTIKDLWEAKDWLGIAQLGLQREVEAMRDLNDRWTDQSTLWKVKDNGSCIAHELTIVVPKEEKTTYAVRLLKQPPIPRRALLWPSDTQNH